MHPAKRSGFALLLVLVVVMICGTILAAVARRCGQKALLAANAQRDLQFRWGASSCQATLMDSAETLLTAQWKAGSPVRPQAAFTVTLGGMSFDMVVADEAAKANVNFLAKQLQQDPGRLSSAIRRLEADAHPSLPVVLRPLPAGATGAAPASQPATGTATPPQAGLTYASFEQVLSFDAPAKLLGKSSSEETVMRRRLTFWGDGKVNLCRADVTVLREVLGGRVDDAKLALLDSLRTTQQPLTLDQAYTAMQLTPDVIEPLKSLTTDASDCHSLLIFAQGPTRNWYRLYVRRESDDPNSAVRLMFSW